jgi:hypothetical protein
LFGKARVFVGRQRVTRLLVEFHRSRDAVNKRLRALAAGSGELLMG